MSKFQTVCLIQTGLAEEVSSRIYESFPISVGRSNETSIGIADPGISRLHAELRLKKGEIYIVDLGSANGTFFNGERLEPQTPQLFGPEDLVEFGTNRIPMRIQPYEKAFERKQVSDAKTIELLDAAHAEIKRIGEIYQANQAQAQANHDRKIAEQLEAAREEATVIVRDARARAEEIARAAQDHHDSVVGSAAGDAQATVNEMIRVATEQSELIANNIIDQGEAKLVAITEARRQEHETLMAQGQAKLAQLRREDEERAQAAAIVAADELEARRLEILGEAEQQAADAVTNARQHAAELVTKATQMASMTTGAAESYATDTIEKAEAEAKATLDKANAEAARVNSQTEQIYQAEVDRGTRVVEELKLRTEQEMSARVEQSQVMLKNAVEKSTELIENAERVSKAQLADAEIKSTAMLKVAREDSTALLEKTQKDILEQFTAHQNEMRQLRIDTENDLKASTDEVRHVQETVDSLTHELTSTESKLEQAQKSLKQVLASLASKEDEDREATARIGGAEKQVQDLEQRRDKISQEFAELQKRHADVAAVINAKQQEWDTKQAHLEAELTEAQAKARDEVAAYRQREMAIIDKLKLEELKTLEMGRGEEYERINAHRAEIVSEVLKSVEGHFLAKLRPVIPGDFDWSSVSNALHGEMKSELEQKVYEISRRDQPAVENVQLFPKQQRLLKRSKQGGVAVALMITLLMLIPTTRGFILSTFGQKTSAADRYAQEMQVERERRYVPEKTRSWKESYTDSVLYTEGYVQMKLDEKSQEKWIRDLHSYLYGKLRVDEDSIIKIVSLEAALVSNLQEQAGQIHPDYVAEKTARMRETEAQALVEIKKLLGKEQNFEKFQKYSQDYYYNEYLLRLPANDTPAEAPSSDEETP